MADQQIDPVQYPVLRIGDRDYTLKFRQYDIIQLAKGGLNIFEAAALRFNPMSIEGMGVLHTLVQHAIAHEAAMSTEEISKALDFDRVLEVNIALTEAIKKAVSRITAGIPAPQTPAAEPKVQ